MECLDIDTLNHLNTSCTLVGHNELHSTVTEFDMEDKWRAENPQCKQFTWTNRTATQASRFDRFYVPKDMLYEL